MTKSRSAAHDGRPPQGGAEPTVEELLAWERSEFLVLVAYFRALPRKLGTLLAACVQLSHDLLGNGYIRGAARRAKPRRGRGRSPADEAKHFQAQWCESLPRTLHSFLESDLPQRFNRGELCRLHAVQTPAEARSPAHQFRWALEFDAEPTYGDQTLEPTPILSLGLGSLARPW